MSVRESKGFPVVFWKWLEGAEKPEEREESRTATRRVPLARLYHVFNVQQCELPARLQPFLQIEPESPDPQTQIAACEQILAHMPNRPTITHSEARAYYTPSPGHRQHARAWALPQSRALLLRAVS